MNDKVREAFDDVDLYLNSQTTMKGRFKELWQRLGAAILKNPWQPIETAPKDGSQILIWFKNTYSLYDETSQTVVRYIDGRWQMGLLFNGTSININQAQILAWMPLPTPPNGI